MRTILKALTILGFIINCLIGQFYSDLPKNTSSSSLNRGKDDNLNFYSHSNKFNINHGFSMSMMSNGQSLYSVSQFNNHISYQLLDHIAVLKGIANRKERKDLVNYLLEALVILIQAF